MSTKDQTAGQKSFDEVKKPKHYNTGKIEVIDFIEDQRLGFHLGNAVKYIARCGKKPAGKKPNKIADHAKEIQDLEKARWYIDREIQRRRKEYADNTHNSSSRS